LVSSDPLRLVGFQAIFENHKRVDLVGAQLPEILRDSGLHLVLLCMPITEPLFDLLETIKGFRPDIRVVVMSNSMESDLVQRMIRSGAKGFLPDTATEQEIALAVDTVADGSIWAPRRILAKMIDHEFSSPAPSPAKIELTGREREVLELLVGGSTNRQIAAAMKIEERTVKAHIAKLMRKFGVSNRTALTMHVISHNIIAARRPILRRKK
jgi:DNA-binding NarL/FixJ family response regulator